MRERTDLDKKPTWYLFLFANVAVFIGAIVTLVLFKNGPVDTVVNFVPTLVCNLVALVACGFFIWLESKGIMNKVAHFRRKWLWWYLVAIIVFIVAIIFTFVFYWVYRQFYFAPNGPTWKVMIANPVVAGVLTLVSIGLQRYARYKIDLDIYKRNHGELPKKEEMEKDRAKQEKAQAKQDTKSKASSGLADSIDKQ